MVRFSNVSKTYPNGTAALRDVSFRIDDGEFVFLVGPSGSGKSTVTRLITAETDFDEGRIMVNGHNLGNIRRSKIPELRRTLGVVFQDFRLIENKTVWDNLAMVMRVVGASPRTIRKRIPYVLGLVGLAGKEKMLPGQLSGGEQQRVAIARALVNNAQMIIADEPTGNLDPVRSVEIMQLLEEINTMGTTILVVTHERELVKLMDKRVIAISDGEIVHDRSSKQTFGKKLEDLPEPLVPAEDPPEPVIPAEDPPEPAVPAEDPPLEESLAEEAPTATQPPETPDGDDNGEEQPGEHTSVEANSPTDG